MSFLFVLLWNIIGQIEHALSCQSSHTWEHQVPTSQYCPLGILQPEKFLAISHHRFTGSFVPLGSQVASPWILCEAVRKKVAIAEGNNCKQKIIKEGMVLVTRGLSRGNGSKSRAPQDSGKDKLGMKYRFSTGATRNMVNLCTRYNYSGTELILTF